MLFMPTESLKNISRRTKYDQFHEKFHVKIIIITNKFIANENLELETVNFTTIVNCLKLKAYVYHRFNVERYFPRKKLTTTCFKDFYVQNVLNLSFAPVLQCQQ